MKEPSKSKKRNDLVRALEDLLNPEAIIDAHLEKRPQASPFEEGAEEFADLTDACLELIRIKYSGTEGESFPQINLLKMVPKSVEASLVPHLDRPKIEYDWETRTYQISIGSIPGQTPAQEEERIIKILREVAPAIPVATLEVIFQFLRILSDESRAELLQKFHPKYHILGSDAGKDV